MENLRTFVAINVKVDQILFRKWQEIKLLLRNDSVKWVDEQTLHLTLFFLGETPSDKIESIAKNIEVEIKNIPSFKIVLQEFGVFGNPKNPKVIWAGIAKSEQLFQLKKLVSSTITPFGFDEPDGKFSPHFTLGRIKNLESANDINNYINMNKTEVLQEVVVDKVIFYQSILKPNGPVYIPIKEIKLLSL